VLGVFGGLVYITGYFNHFNNAGFIIKLALHNTATSTPK